MTKAEAKRHGFADCVMGNVSCCPDKSGEAQKAYLRGWWEGKATGVRFQNG